MKFRKSLWVFPLLCLCGVISSAATASSQVSVDDQIQRLREGKKITISDAEFLKARTDAFDKFYVLAADLYVEQIKWSLISPEKHGGWPFRSFIVEEPEWISEIYRNLKVRRADWRFPNRLCTHLPRIVFG